jgi:hypothetical protein
MKGRRTVTWNVIKAILKSPSWTTCARSARQPHCRFVLSSFSPYAQQQYSNMSIHHCIGLVCHSHCPSTKTWSVTLSRPVMSHPSSIRQLLLSPRTLTVFSPLVYGVAYCPFTGPLPDGNDIGSSEEGMSAFPMPRLCCSPV